MDSQQLKDRIKQILKNFNKTSLDILAVEADKSIKANFAAEGRPIHWEAKKHPNKYGILRGKTNRLNSTINIIKNYNESGENSITLSSNLPYSKIQQEGGTINRSAGSVRLRTNRHGETRFASHRHKKFREASHGAYVITIPARPFLIIPEQDYPRIINSIKMTNQ